MIATTGLVTRAFNAVWPISFSAGFPLPEGLQHLLEMAARNEGAATQ